MLRYFLANGQYEGTDPCIVKCESYKRLLSDVIKVVCKAKISSCTKNQTVLFSLRWRSCNNLYSVGEKAARILGIGDCSATRARFQDHGTCP